MTEHQHRDSPCAAPGSTEEEWLSGWDPTPWIVSVWAGGDGRATIWRRHPDTGELLREEARFRPWLLLDRIDDLHGVEPAESRRGDAGRVTCRQLDGPGDLRYRLEAADSQTLASVVLRAASRRLGRPALGVRDLGNPHVLLLPPEEQYLVATGRTYFRGLSFDQLRRMQFDLETTGLEPDRHRIFMIAVRDPSGVTQVLEAGGEEDASEAALIRRLVTIVAAADPT